MAEVLRQLRQQSFCGSVIAEVSTRGAASREDRVADLQQTLEFARTHLRED